MLAFLVFLLVFAPLVLFGAVLLIGDLGAAPGMTGGFQSIERTDFVTVRFTFSQTTPRMSFEDFLLEIKLNGFVGLMDMQNGLGLITNLYIGGRVVSVSLYDLGADGYLDQWDYGIASIPSIESGEVLELGLWYEPNNLFLDEASFTF